jgi:hypothetical protein
MPKPGGVELLQQMRKAAGGSLLPIVVLRAAAQVSGVFKTKSQILSDNSFVFDHENREPRALSIPSPSAVRPFRT